MKKSWKADDVARLLMDPRSTGVGGVPEIIPREMWIKANINLMHQVGEDAYFTGLLALLHEIFDGSDGRG